MAAPLAFALLVRQKILDDESALAGSKRSAAAKASHLAVFHASRSFHADNIVFRPAVRAVHRRWREGFHGTQVWITHRNYSIGGQDRSRMCA